MNKTIIDYTRENDIEAIKNAIKNGVDVNLQDQYGSTALILASCYDYEEIVKLLIENGADINLYDDEGNTGLILASCRGHDRIVKLLLKNGANINLQDNDGSTALIWASFSSYEEVVKLLLENGTDINLQDNNGKTALDYAVRKKNNNIVQLLEQYPEKSKLANNILANDTLKIMADDEKRPTFEELCEIKIVNGRKTSLLDIVAYNVPAVKAQWFQNKLVQVYKLTPEKVANMPDSAFKKGLKKHFEKHAYYKKMREQKSGGK